MVHVMSESAVEDRVRLKAASKNNELWRNNVGVLPDVNGRPVRYGLANTSSKVNKNIKSSDLIGITTVLITPDMVGQRIGVFTAVETKKQGWVFSLKDLRAVAQKRFHDIVKKAGGYAGFATCEEDYERITRNET